MCDNDGNPLFRPSTGRPPNRAQCIDSQTPRWESLYAQRHQVEEKRQDLARQLLEEEQRVRSTAARMNPKSEALLAGAALDHVKELHLVSKPLFYISSPQ
jgi:hypothetical protein